MFVEGGLGEGLHLRGRSPALHAEGYRFNSQHILVGMFPSKTLDSHCQGRQLELVSCQGQMALFGFRQVIKKKPPSRYVSRVYLLNENIQ